MPERLAKENKEKIAVPAAPLVQINSGFTIGGMRREEPAGSGGPRKPWEESPGTDWRDVVRRRVYNGPKRPVSVVSSSNSRRPLDLPRIWYQEDGIVEDGTNGRLFVYLQFSGDIDLGPDDKHHVSFRKGQRYYKPPWATSAVYATLEQSSVLMICTVEDSIYCRVTSPFLRGINLVVEPREYHIAELTEAYNRQEMAISVLDPRLAVVRYDKFHVPNYIRSL